MKILVTGAFGGIGFEVIKKGYELGHEMSAFDIDNSSNRTKAKLLKPFMSHLFLGDVRNSDDLRKALIGQDVLIHLSAIITPLSELNPALSDSVNIGGTLNILKLIEEEFSNISLIFTSSMSIMGKDKNRIPPLKVSDPVYISSNYTRQKIECENALNQSTIQYAIFRLGAVINTEFRVAGGSIDKVLQEVFAMSLDNRIEGIWNIDVATALIKASELFKIKLNSINHKTFFLGGGKEKGWQLTVRTFYTQVFKAIGFGLPYESSFSKEAYYADWLDTQESEDLLHYQMHSFNDYLNSVKKKMGLKRYFFIILSPLIRLILSKLSIVKN